jgi:primase-polymerase (primpol)-like protein
MECPGHKYEHIETKIFVKEDGKKDGRFFTETGKCIHCGKDFVWSNYVDKTRIRIKNDVDTGKRIIVVEENTAAPTASYDLLPLEIKALRNWVGWKLEERDGKSTKIPYSQTGVMASSTDPTSWRSFNEVCNILPSKERGIGFVFDGGGIVGIDVDHCLDENGVIDPKYEYIIECLKSYTEISPSGTGLHILIKCNSPPYETGKKKNNLEIYSSGRYFTVTGNRWLESPLKINSFSPELVRAICDPFVNSPKKENIEEIKEYTNTSSRYSTQLSDEEIVKIAGLAKNCNKFNDLMSGRNLNSDKSSNDMALANILAFYSDDPSQICRIMMRSGLVREKWQRDDYLMFRTIPKAIQERTGRYSKDDYSDVSLKDLNYTIGPSSKNAIVPPTEYSRAIDEGEDEKGDHRYCASIALTFSTARGSELWKWMAS